MKICVIYLKSMFFIFSLIGCSKICAEIEHKPILVKGNNLTVNIFRTTKEALSPFLMPGFEASADAQGNYRIFLGSVNFNDTFGIGAFSEMILFTEVKPKGKGSNYRHFHPFWAVTNSQEASEIYTNQFGLLMEYNTSLKVIKANQTQKSGVSGKSDINGKFLVSLNVEKASDREMTEFTDARIIGSYKQNLLFTKDVFAVRFYTGKINHLEIEAEKGSPLRLIDQDKHLFTLFSESHTTFLQRLSF